MDEETVFYQALKYKPWLVPKRRSMATFRKTLVEWNQQEVKICQNSSSSLFQKW